MAPAKVLKLHSPIGARSFNTLVSFLYHWRSLILCKKVFPIKSRGCSSPQSDFYHKKVITRKGGHLLDAMCSFLNVETGSPMQHHELPKADKQQTDTLPSMLLEPGFLMENIFLHKSSAKLHIPELRTTLAVKKRHCAPRMQGKHMNQLPK